MPLPPPQTDRQSDSCGQPCRSRHHRSGRGTFFYGDGGEGEEELHLRISVLSIRRIRRGSDTAQARSLPPWSAREGGQNDGRGGRAQVILLTSASSDPV